MRYVTIPEAVGNPQGEPIPLSQLLTEQVWPNPYWRATDGVDRSRMLFDIYSKFEGKKAGEVVELTDKEYEALLPLVTMRGQTLAPHLAVPLQRLMQPFFEATTDPPPGQVN